MSAIARFICLFAIIYMMVAPAMACCLTGQHEANPAAAPLPSCHDVQKTPRDASALLSKTDQKEVYCPGCDDCTILTISVSEVDGPIVSITDDMNPHLPLYSSVSAYLRFEFVRTTGPPPNRPLSLRTPIALKERLTV